MQEVGGLAATLDVFPTNVVGEDRHRVRPSSEVCAPSPKKRNQRAKAGRRSALERYSRAWPTHSAESLNRSILPLVWGLYATKRGERPAVVRSGTSAT